MKAVFVSPEVLNWPSALSGWAPFPRLRQRRDYQVLSHAEQLLARPDSVDRRGDCVNALNRVIDMRVRLLNQQYLIDRILGSKKSIDNLERIGAARRYMLLQINRIRNFFEHRDQRPPPRERLKAYVELTWYFLKATDIPAYVPRVEIQLNREGVVDEGEDWLEFGYAKRMRSRFPWKVRTSLDAALYAFAPIKGWLEFAFPRKDAHVLPNKKNRFWGVGGRLVSDGVEHRVLSKFFEA